MQNAAARLICRLRRFDHVTDALVRLHWLRVPERFVYKIAVLTFRVLHGIAPEYLGPVFRVADLSGRQPLRSAGTNRLVVLVPSFKLSTIDTRAFTVANPRVWNSHASRHYIGTVAVDHPPTTKNLSIPIVILSSHRLIISLSRWALR